MLLNDIPISIQKTKIKHLIENLHPILARKSRSNEFESLVKKFNFIRPNTIAFSFGF